MALAALNRTTGSAQAGSSFFTKFTRLLTSNRRIKLGLNGGCDYLSAHEPTWLKIRNRSYSQWVGREELFERERGGDPDFRGWDDCVRACAGGGVVAVQNWEGSSGISRRVASELIVYVLAKDHSGTHI
jgi:hypothetical protein